MTKRAVRQDLKLNGPSTRPSSIICIPSKGRLMSIYLPVGYITNCLHTCRGRKMLWHGKLTLFQFSGQIFNIYSYAFPPFRLILRCLQKVDMEEADCVIIIPVWKSQVWFTKLISLLVDVPVLLPRKANLLHHPLQTDIAHPIKWTLDIQVLEYQ